MNADGKKAGRIPWLTGLKGFCCLHIFTHHFFLGFYPATYYGAEAASKTVSGIDVRMASEPFGVILNGSYSLCTFLMISAFLFACKVMRDEESGKRTDFFTLIRRRYLRLMVPFGAVVCLYYVVIRTLDRLHLNVTGKTLSLPFREAVKHVVLYQWFFYDVEIDGIFWTMSLFLVGACLAAFFALFDRKERWYMPFVYLGISYPIVLRDHYYAGVLMGVILADLLCFGRLQDLSARFPALGQPAVRYAAGILSLLVSVFLGGYPCHAPVDGTAYALLPEIGILGAVRYDYFHCLASFLLMGALFLLPWSFGLSGKVMTWLGERSFAFYLVHMLILEYFGYYFEMVLEQRTGSFHLSCAATYAACLLIILPAAELMHRTVEAWSLKLL